MIVKPRPLFIVLFFAATFLFLASLYFEFVEHLNPCPLCILQRMAVLVLAIVGFMAAVQNPKKWGCCIYSLFGILAALFGLLVAARQAWLQYFAAERFSSCGASLGYMLANLPFQQTMHLLFAGSGACNAISWSFLSLSMAAWLIIFFAGFVLGYVWVMFVALRGRKFDSL